MYVLRPLLNAMLVLYGRRKRLTHECCINESVSQSYVGKSVECCESSLKPVVIRNTYHYPRVLVYTNKLTTVSLLTVELKLAIFHRVANPNGAVTRTRK